MRRTVTVGAALGAVLALLLSACGGGGGTSPPVGGPSPNPGGGPSSSPSTSPSPSTSGSPASSPTPARSATPVPTSPPTFAPTPTPAPTATPLVTPTPLPTPTPTPGVTPTPNGTLTVTNGHGEVNGTDDLFTQGIGKDAGDGDYPAGGHGPVNTTFGPDNVPCLSSMYSGPIPPGYHVHAFLGIYYNGSEIAVPDGVGIADPQGDITYQGIPNWTQYSYNSHNPGQPGCFYELHTHDPSGTIHVESSNPNGVSQDGTIYTLGDFLALWGIPVGPAQFGPFQGPITVYTSGQQGRGGHYGMPEIPSNLYAVWNGDMRQIPLYSHEVIWVLIGSGNPTGASLPNVAFWDEY